LHLPALSTIRRICPRRRSARPRRGRSAELGPSGSVSSDGATRRASCGHGGSSAHLFAGEGPFRHL
ncbi:uncharacterized protein METZ01_LOCUS324123, partial [marine metagenome]